MFMLKTNRQPRTPILPLLIIRADFPRNRLKDLSKRAKNTKNKIKRSKGKLKPKMG